VELFHLDGVITKKIPIYRVAQKMYTHCTLILMSKECIHFFGPLCMSARFGHCAALFEFFPWDLLFCMCMLGGGTVRDGKQNWNFVVSCRLHLELIMVPDD
jgi:hypothetical protein